MSEEETTTIKAEGDTTSDTAEGDKPKEIDVVTRAELAVKELAKATETKQAATRELKEERAKQILGGQTAASQAPEKKEPVSDEQYYKDVMSGKYNIKRE